jgi:uncharacterized Zn finger protein
MGQPVKADADNTLRCKNCGHTKELTSDILKALAKKYLASRNDATIFLSQFKCTICGEKEPELMESKTKTTTSISDPRADRTWLSCHQCGGDGGAGGRCPRCFGNGFEPSY